MLGFGKCLHATCFGARCRVPRTLPCLTLRLVVVLSSTTYRAIVSTATISTPSGMYFSWVAAN